MIFEDLGNLIYIVLIGTAAYLGMIVFLRLSGNRTLSKMNSFDLVVTIAFGSTLSTVLVNRSVTFAEGITAIGLLVFLQFAITWLSVRSRAINKAVKTPPTLVLENGKYRTGAMKAVRITEDEICSAIRKKGYGGIERIAAVVLESDGSLSVITQENSGSANALNAVNE